MPRGFTGQPARTYLAQVSTAHTRADGASQQIPLSAPSITTRTRQLPFTPDTAGSGQFITRRGDSSNVVVLPGEYEAIARHVSQLDDAVGECLYKAIEEIEEMCNTIFILPAVVPGCLNICNGVKTSLNQYRRLTDDAMLETRNYAREMLDIG